MKTATLQLRFYFVTELNVSANREHAPDKPISLTDEDILIKTDFKSKPNDGRRWEVTLRIQQQAGPATNPPYYFTIELVGAFDVDAAYPANKVEWMVRTNATSVLYSTAREILRNAMAQGPFCPLLLPTVSFYTPDTNRILEEANMKNGNQITPPEGQTP